MSLIKSDVQKYSLSKRSNASQKSSFATFISYNIIITNIPNVGLYIYQNIMDKLIFYRVQDLRSHQPLLAKSTITLAQLSQQIKNTRTHEFTIYYQYRPLQLSLYANITLQNIVNEDPSPQPPVFHVYDHITESDHSQYAQKYGKAVAQHQKSSQSPKQYWIGSNGHVLFDTRKTALMASSVAHATKKQQYSDLHSHIIKSYSSSIIDDENQPPVQNEGLIRRVLSKLGIIKRKPTSKNLMNTIQAIKAIDDEQKLKSHITREYSDYDPNFATYLEAVYIRFAILNKYRLHYVEYQSMEESIIQYKIPQNAKIAIIGDYGTGLPDSINLLKDIIINKQVDIILHLGDVYYAGTPHEYQQNIIKPLQELRKLAKSKIAPDKDVLFYSIPGNHDYYSWGLPFLTFVFNINQNKFQKQKASYFCLRTQGNRWQFIGLDTAYHDSNPLNQIDGFSLGPHLRHRQVEWFQNKMETFPGSTILLTHHQLFSIHDRICGSISDYRQFSCVNPLLSAQLFKYLPHISAWYWGHQHAFMLFQEGALGLPKCRLLGNSSFHVFEGEGPYKRKQNFPHIPLIEDDQIYLKKYLPVDPKGDKKQNFYNLCYAVIDLGKEKKIPSEGIFASWLPVSYYCCPCYPSQQKDLPHFQPYLIYEQFMKPKISCISLMDETKETTQGLTQKQNILSGLLQGQPIQLKSQIGLFVDRGDILNLEGCKLGISVVKSSWSEQQIDQGLKNNIMDRSIIEFKPMEEGKEEQGCIMMGHKFKIIKKRVLKDQYNEIRIGDSFYLKDDQNSQYLGCFIHKQVTLKMFLHDKVEKACLFQFIRSSKVKKGQINLSQ